MIRCYYLVLYLSDVGETIGLHFARLSQDMVPKTYFLGAENYNYSSLYKNDTNETSSVRFSTNSCLPERSETFFQLLLLAYAIRLERQVKVACS